MSAMVHHLGMEQLAERLAQVPGVVAVTLGGSRATGTHGPDSDWDFGVYYRGELDLDAVRALGYPGEVFAPGDWSGFMNGGAWLTVDGEQVDLIYRDLDEVERCIALAEEGRFEISRTPGYLAGMPSHVLVGELAVGKVLHGDLPSPSFPEALRQRAPERWRSEAEFALLHGAKHAVRADPAGCAGMVAQAVIATSYGRLCERGEWALNDKGIVARAGLTNAWGVLGVIGVSARVLERSVEQVRSMCGLGTWRR
jgi:predicted nucleotidyltransferase